MLLPSTALTNVGVFTGYGHTIELSSTESIQMVSEEVTIVPGRGRFLFDGGVTGMDRVEYDCVFTLKNLKNQKIGIQVGFPLNSQFLNPPYNKKKKTSNLVAQYNFISQVEGHQYTVRYVPGDKDRKLKNLFLWDMTFEPSEIKILRVTYSMPISMTLATSALNWKESEYNKEWYKGLENCMLEWFGYVTETAKSWAGQVEKATFQVYLEGFESYIYRRPLMEGLNAAKKEKTIEKFPVWRPVIFRVMEPKGWKKDDNGFWELSYDGYEGENSILFYYYILTLPRTVEDVNRLMSRLSRNGFSNEDREDLRDILREYNGVKTENKRIRKFLKNQVWYGKEVQQLIPDQVLDAI